jgi:hypothetical protein
MATKSLPADAAAAGSRRGFLAALAVLAAGFRPASAEEAVRLDFADLYKSIGVLGIQFSTRALELKGHPVAMQGFMAPPLKAESDFFVLTRQPLALCPFCQSDADWPADIVVVYLQRQATPTTASQTIEVSGRLEVGSWTDPKTGFVSAVRLVDARFRRV